MKLGELFWCIVYCFLLHGSWHALFLSEYLGCLPRPFRLTYVPLLSLIDGCVFSLFRRPSASASRARHSYF
jgi:hypothetical protein